MKDITDLFSEAFLPVKALLFYKSTKDQSFYVESHDLDKTGVATNVHPLNERESLDLGSKLRASEDKADGFLNHKALLPENLLWYSTQIDGGAMWYTQKMRVSLLFTPALSIPDGLASIPPLLWKASKTGLQVWALENGTRPQANTILCLAPFFNVYADGCVCMGNVSIHISRDCSLLDFMELWTKYFFASTFSHLLVDKSPVKTNIVQLWQSLVGSDRAFPMNQLKKSKSKLSDISL
ncbi:PRTRC system protein B [Pedobacter fastidiosus]|uniref:PRTRC system protein B n=1 Tax=Pedobacter fastidiosus TaxID=2765361 RepID=A0ABR7KXH5_9SPHI|nr:PRTRC system protein B [Pedobacter fastidiosus]MBC6112447.1 PRTRC system protein B [Pedobacter fastidiosus]